MIYDDSDICYKVYEVSSYYNLESSLEHFFAIYDKIYDCYYYDVWEIYTRRGNEIGETHKTCKIVEYHREKEL